MVVVVHEQRRVKLFKLGGHQAAQIPREFELPGRSAMMRQEGERLVPEAALAVSLLELLAALSPLEDELPEVADLPARPVAL
jgi:antitoxin VapB